MSKVKMQYSYTNKQGQIVTETMEFQGRADAHEYFISVCEYGKKQGWTTAQIDWIESTGTETLNRLYNRS